LYKLNVVLDCNSHLTPFPNIYPNRLSNFYEIFAHVTALDALDALDIGLRIGK